MNRLQKKGFAFVTVEAIVAIIATVIIIIVSAVLISSDLQFELRVNEVTTNLELKRSLHTILSTPTQTFLEEVSFTGQDITLVQQAITQMQQYQTIGEFFAKHTSKQDICTITELVNKHKQFSKYTINVLKQEVDPWKLSFQTKQDNPYEFVSARGVAFYSYALPTPTQEIRNIRIIEKNKNNDAGAWCT